MSKYIGTPVVNVSVDTVDVTGDITTTDTTPEVIIVNNTHEDTDGGREGKVTFKGQQSGGEETTLAQIQASHDGTSDDEKGDLIFKTNDGSDGASPTEAMRIDSAGNVGIGTSTVDTKLHVENASGTTLVKTEVASGSVVGYDIQKTGSTTQHWRIADGVVANGQLEVYDQTNSKSMMSISTSGVVFNEDANDRDFRVEADSSPYAFAVDGAGYGSIKFGANDIFSYGQTSGNGRMGYAIDNGSSYGTVMISNNADRGWSMFYLNKFAYSSGDDRRYINWYVNGVSLCSVQLNTAGTAIEYQTTSDRRLKENIQDITGGIDTVKQLRPRSFEWITQEDKTFPAHGFIADEADDIIPDAVTGEANAVDEHGNPIYQSMEYSKLVPVLTAALKEAIAKIETLETQNTTQATQIADLITRVTALEGE